MRTSDKKRDGFNGEKLISLPQTLFNNRSEQNLFLKAIYINQIGYFPKAAGHYRNRPKGCPDNIFIYCTHGKGWYSIDAKKYEVSANQFFIIPATDKHLRYGSDPTDPWTIYWMHFTGDSLMRINESLAIQDLLTPQSIPFDKHKIKLWEEIYKCLEKGYSKENLTYANLSLFYFLANFLYPRKNIELTKTPGQDLSDKIIEYMKANISQRLSVEDMAIKFSYSPSHFQSLFRKRTGISPIEYFIQLKMQYACQLLALSDMRINEVATAVGYSDAYYFSRLFRKVMGSSPAYYKSRQKI